MNIASPRTGSPPVTAAACSRMRERCSAYSKTTPMIATANRIAARIASASLVESDRMGLLRRLQPAIEKDQRRDSVHQPAGNPHDEAGELLIGGRIEADAGHAHRGIVGIPG